MPVIPNPSALNDEYAVLVSDEATAWRATAPHPEGSPEHDGAMTRWAAARTALDAFPVRLAAMRGPDPELVRLKARVLLTIHGGGPDALDFAIEAALSAAKEDDNAPDEALALSIARDVLAA